MRDDSILPNWKELVANSSFSSTEEQFSLADVWLRENSLAPDDLDSTPLLSSVSTHFPISKGDHVDTFLVSKGASFDLGPSAASEGVRKVNYSPSDLPLFSEGDSSLPLCTADCEGDYLHMPPMVNLETVGLRQSSCTSTKSVRAQEADQTKELASLSQFSFFSLFVAIAC